MSNVPELRGRLRQTNHLVQLAARLANQAERVHGHFHTVRTDDDDIGEIALAISEAHMELQLAICDWMVERRKQ